MLEKMKNEPRDATWAKRMEKLLRESAVSHPGEVRALECRSTVCAMEVSSAPPAYHGLNDAHALGLFEVGNAYGYEWKDNQLVSISLRVWERHSPKD